MAQFDYIIFIFEIFSYNNIRAFFILFKKKDFIIFTFKLNRLLYYYSNNNSNFKAIRFKNKKKTFMLIP